MLVANSQRIFRKEKIIRKTVLDKIREVVPASQANTHSIKARFLLDRSENTVDRIM